MPNSFEPATFVTEIARRLVFEFTAAAQAGTPGLTGAAREYPARKQLEKMLPGSVAVGSGLVLDSYRNVSKQQDVVIYEQQFCPVFVVNDTPEATYHPVEGVIAVGEVKSRLDGTSLEDAFEKIASVKRLKRYTVPTDDKLGLGPLVSYRVYGSPGTYGPTKATEYQQSTKFTDQVFGFILCGQSVLKPETIVDRSRALWQHYSCDESPNLIVSLNDGFIQPYDQQNNVIASSVMEANAIMMCQQAEKAFPHLIRQLNHIIRHGRTVSISCFGRYLDLSPNERETFQLNVVSPFK